MSEFALTLPVNQTSFGQVSIGLLKEVFRRSLNPCLFPIGESNLSTQKPNESFNEWLSFCVKKGMVKIHVNGKNYELYIKRENHKMQLLRPFELINQKRRKIANYYFKKIKNKKINLFNINNNSCFHQFVILVRDRKNFLNHLKNYRIPYGFHYPYAIHKLEVIKKYCIDKNFKNSIFIAERGVSIPMDPFLNKKKLDYIINKFNCF